MRLGRRPDGPAGRRGGPRAHHPAGTLHRAAILSPTVQRVVFRRIGGDGLRSTLYSRERGVYLVAGFRRRAPAGHRGRIGSPLQSGRRPDLPLLQRGRQAGPDQRQPDRRRAPGPPHGGERHPVRPFAGRAVRGLGRAIQRLRRALPLTGKPWISARRPRIIRCGGSPATPGSICTGHPTRAGCPGRWDRSCSSAICRRPSSSRPRIPRRSARTRRAGHPDRSEGAPLTGPPDSSRWSARR